MAEKKKQTYAQAIAELEEIVTKLQNNECEIDELKTYTNRSLSLLRFCKDKLFETDEEIKKISQILHIAVPEFYYIPTGMKYDKVQILEEAQMAIIRYQYNDHFVYFHLAANEKELSQGDWKDKEKVQIETLDDVIDVEMGSVSENNEENYYAKWKYKDSYYQLSGQIEKEELMKILSEMQYNL